MKAVVYKEYGPPEVLQLQDVPAPKLTEKEVLVQIHATTVSVEDPKMRSGQFDFSPWMNAVARLVLGWRRPKHTIMGFEFSGVVTETGPKVRRVSVGEEVYGYTGLNFGAYAQYKCLPEEGVYAVKPSNLSHAEAASIPNAALTAMVYMLKKGKLAPGESILINGASGSVGTAAVQLAKAVGVHVTGVASGPKLAGVKALGADEVIDYMQDDFSAMDGSYDMIFDVAGTSSYQQCKPLLKKKGRYLKTVFGLKEVLLMLWTSLFGGRKVIVASSNFAWKAEDLDYLRNLIEAGHMKPIVDRCFPLAHASEAHRYVESGAKTGNVVLTVEHSGSN